MNKIKKNQYHVLVITMKKILYLYILFLILYILSKENIVYKNRIEKMIYKDTLNYSKIRIILNKYLGGIETKKSDNTIPVSKPQIKYKYIESFYDGVKLTFNNTESIQALDNGIVIYIGQKPKYGNTIIINCEGYNVWYGNIANTNLKLYDNVSRGDYIAEVNKFLYLVFEDKGFFLDYTKYI